MVDCIDNTVTVTELCHLHLSESVEKLYAGIVLREFHDARSILELPVIGVLQGLAEFLDICFLNLICVYD